jgi:hypothetical protein
MNRLLTVRLTDPVTDDVETPLVPRARTATRAKPLF